MAALSATAWVTLWLWGRSPYSRYLDPGNWTEIGVAGALCRALPGGSEALTGLLVAAGWLLMLAAMMLPTTLPLLDIFRRLTARRVDRRWLMALVITGYLAVWGLFGLAAHIAGRAVFTGVRRSDWLLAHGWIIGAAVLATAGLYQFSALKYRCLDKCRAPLGFVIEHWRGAHERWHAFVLGGRHGAFCLGCCSDAHHVRRRQRQYRLDAGARGRHGRRKEPSFRPPPRRAARRPVAARRAVDRARRRDRLRLSRQTSSFAPSNRQRRGRRSDIASPAVCRRGCRRRRARRRSGAPPDAPPAPPHRGRLRRNNRRSGPLGPEGR